MHPEHILPEFHVGNAVYHVTDPDMETPGVVVALVYYKDFLLYKIQWQGVLTEHQGLELRLDEAVAQR